MTRVAATHDFRQSLAKEKVTANAPWWSAVYRKHFPNFSTFAANTHDGKGQRMGVDHVVVLNNGHVVKVDCKVRSTTFLDICLEYWSSKEDKIPGWVAKDLDCDYILYLIVPRRKSYLLPFPALRLAWIKYHREWVAKYRRVESKNTRYTTVSVAVPAEVVYAAMEEVCAATHAEIDFGDNADMLLSA